MSYQVLARKWRPKDFTEMVGQEHVRRALGNALDSQRLHHAYLFTGTRGVGKTTIARILAKSLNCEQGVSSTPCSSCATCVDIDQGRFVDLIEVDAASRTKVEDTREILDNVQYAPNQGRYKVYLIDEVHMLSTSSFNALLKTLEEPPEHVKFLLATTDPHKLPATVLSRCLQFNLLRMDLAAISAHLQHILHTEQIEFEASALKLLAKSADGSMRDALSLLDQAIAFGAGKVNFADVAAMLGSVANAELFSLIDKLIQADAVALLQHVATLASNNVNFASLLNELLLFLHQLALAKRVPSAVDEQLFDGAQLQQLAAQISEADLQLYYQIALVGKRDLPLAYDAKSGFEMIMLRMLAFYPSNLATATETNANQAAANNAKKLPAAKAEAPLAANNLATPEPATQVAISAPPAAPASTAHGNNRQRRQELRQSQQQANATPAGMQNLQAAIAPPPKPPSKEQAIANSPAAIAVSSASSDNSDNSEPPATTSNNSASAQAVAADEPAEFKLNQQLQNLAAASAEESATWLQLLDRLALGGVELQILHNSVLLARHNNIVQLRLRSSCAALIGENLAQHIHNIQTAVSDYLGAAHSIELGIGDGDGETYSERNQRIYGERHEQAISSIMHDPVVQDLQKLFAVNINPKYIKPLELENPDERPTR